MTHARTAADQLSQLLRRERVAAADFLVALADFDRQRLWQDLGHRSLFYFLHRELGLSKGAAFYRKTAAELVQRFPEIVEPLRDGRLCITSVVELAKVITPQNREAVLPRFFQCSKREAMAIAAAIKPAEVVPHREVVAALQPPRMRPPPVVQPVEPPGAPPAVPFHPPTSNGQARPEGTDPTSSADRSLTSALPPRDWAEPLTAERSRLHVTVSRRFLEKLEAARAALSHSHPGATFEQVLEVGLDLAIERHARRRGLVQKPRAKARPAKPEHVPAAVKRAVWTRDGGRCQWPLDSGGICGSTVRVEFDHVEPRARGGPPTVGNGRLLCDVHQAVAARRVFGDAWMDRFTRKGAPGPRERAPP